MAEESPKLSKRRQGMPEPWPRIHGFSLLSGNSESGSDEAV